MDILLFNWRCLKNPAAGGAEKVTHEICRRWVKWGHHVHLVCANYPGGTRNDNVDGVKITRLGGRYSLYPLVFLHYLRNLKGKYDVVIDEINTVPFFTPKFVNEPKIAFIHQLASDILYEELPWPKAQIWYFLEPKVLELYKNIPVVTVSKSTKNDLINVGLPDKNIHIITEGVDHTVYKPRRHKYNNPHVLYVGRLKKFKGVHFLIDAMSRVIQQVPNVKLDIIGDGDLEYKRNLMWRIRKARLEKNVKLHGYVNEEKKIRFMQKSQVLVLPSQGEGFGLVIIEANACGTPTIAANVRGLRDAVVDGETGLLVPYGNVKSLAKAISNILSDEDMRNRFSENAIVWAKNFSWEKTAREFMNIVEAAIC